MLIESVSRDISDENLRNMDADGLAILLIESITGYLDKACPIKDFIIPEEDRPWVDDNIRQMIKDRRIALKLASSYDGTGENVQLKEARRLRQAIDKRGRNNMSKLIKDKLEMYKKNPKKFWEELNKLWKGGKTQNLMSLIDDDTGHIVEPDETASYVNEFFCHVGENLAEPLTNHEGNHGRYDAIRDFPATPQLEDEQFVEIKNPLQFDEIAENTLKYTVDDLDIGKSSGIEDMRSHVVKDTMLGNLYLWTYFINLCISTSVFPGVLKLGMLIPLPKSGNLRSILNWRPITLLPIIGKVIEKILHRQLLNHAEDNSIIDDSQYGFLPNRSTAMAILHVLNALYSARNKGEYVMALFLDVKKAFDVVHHGRLLMKLRRYGLTKAALKMIASYLEERSSRTMANNMMSTPENVSFGVPQGSVLGPLLFLYYINDLPGIVKNCVPVLYADDLVLISRGKDPVQVCHLLQDDLTRVQEWCTLNRLTPNISQDQEYVVCTNNQASKHP